MYGWETWMCPFIKWKYFVVVAHSRLNIFQKLKNIWQRQIFLAASAIQNCRGEIKSQEGENDAGSSFLQYQCTDLHLCTGIAERIAGWSGRKKWREKREKFNILRTFWDKILCYSEGKLKVDLKMTLDPTLCSAQIE